MKWEFISFWRKARVILSQSWGEAGGSDLLFLRGLQVPLPTRAESTLLAFSFPSHLNRATSARDDVRTAGLPAEEEDGAAFYCLVLPPTERSPGNRGPHHPTHLLSIVLQSCWVGKLHKQPDSTTTDCSSQPSSRRQ